MMTIRASIIILVTGLLIASQASAEAPVQLGVELEGSVKDEHGAPLVGVVVSVFGKNLARGARIALTDDAGQFQVEGVPPGMYRLRAYLTGFLPSAYAQVIIEEGVEQVGAVLMSLAALDGDASEDSASSDPERKRNFSELNWLMAHGERNVLKSGDWELPMASLESENELASAAPNFALGGEFGVRAASYDQGLDDFPGSGAGIDGRLAYARLFIPTQDSSQWLVSAQVLESALSSWAGRAEYVKSDFNSHTLNAGVTYGNFLYGSLEEFRPPEAALTQQPVGQRSAEWFGSVYASDAFTFGSTAVSAGVAYEYFGYLDESAYASPHVEVTHPVDSSGRTVVRGAVDYRVLAPGGEDIGLLSRVAYSDYGPSPVTRPSLRAERTARFQLGLERDFAEGTRIGVRMFEERARDQLVKVYTQDNVAWAGAGSGHFTVGNKGDFRTRGVGLSVSQSFGAMQGTVGYTFGIGQALSAELPGASSLEDQEIHDVTTAVATSIDRTQTRLTAAYRFISHPTFAPGGDGFTGEVSQDSRFNIQIFQVLPFIGWNGTSWELMVAVRNLFYEDLEGTSMLDEAAVIDAPRRVLGGVTVRF
jgi:hypothetical protein